MGAARDDLARQLAVEALVPADLPAMALMSWTWRRLAEVLRSGGSSLGRVDVAHWRGAAADGWREVVRVEPGRWWSAAVAFERAATAVDGYASSVGAARVVASTARQLWIDASSPLLRARTTEPGVVVGSRLGGLLDDPRPAQDEAVRLLESARRTVLQAGSLAAREVAAATAEAPAARRFFESTVRPPGGEEAMHVALDALGMVPVVEAVPDLANATWYAAEDRYIEAGLSAVSAIPGPGDVAGGAVLAGTLAARSLRRLDMTAALLDGSREVDLGRGVAPGLVDAGMPRLLDHVPYGFASRQSWETFARTVHEELAKAGYPDAQVYLRGSAVTGFRYRTGEFIGSTGPGDLDLAISSPDLVSRAGDAGAGLRSAHTRTPPLPKPVLERLNLIESVDTLHGLSGGRKVSIMAYADASDILGRGDAILLP